MVKPQRGNSQSISETVQDKMVESSDDEGPEQVAFDESKAAALKSVKNARDSVKRDKELLKEKRRKRQEFFQEQKKNRLLPETLLEELDTKAQKRKLTHSDADNNSDDDDEKEEEQVKVTKPKKVQRRLQANCSVMRLKDDSTDTSLQKSAMDFIQSRLYGSGSQRTTNAEFLSLEKKRGLNQGAAVQFVNKNWGKDQKAKAEKSNKRFIHKRKLLAS
ncbi:nucleolar protein 7 [Trichomycterus rosablanca]|uniref:nucleolar protein 7 n=1 Tax=Trichomycterus rosablanca TaxID=2290929 RepID=UPI002F35D044